MVCGVYVLVWHRIIYRRSLRIFGCRLLYCADRARSVHMTAAYIPGTTRTFSRPQLYTGILLPYEHERYVYRQKLPPWSHGVSHIPPHLDFVTRASDSDTRYFNVILIVDDRPLSLPKRGR